DGVDDHAEVRGCRGTSVGAGTPVDQGHHHARVLERVLHGRVAGRVAVPEQQDRAVALTALTVDAEFLRRRAVRTARFVAVALVVAGGGDAAVACRLTRLTQQVDTLDAGAAGV